MGKRIKNEEQKSIFHFGLPTSDFKPDCFYLIEFHSKSSTYVFSMSSSLIFIFLQTKFRPTTHSHHHPDKENVLLTVRRLL